MLEKTSHLPVGSVVTSPSPPSSVNVCCWYPASPVTVVGGRGRPEQVESWTDLTKRAKAARDGYLELAQAELGSA